MLRQLHFQNIVLFSFTTSKPSTQVILLYSMFRGSLTSKINATEVASPVDLSNVAASGCVAFRHGQVCSIGSQICATPSLAGLMQLPYLGYIQRPLQLL